MIVNDETITDFFEINLSASPEDAGTVSGYGLYPENKNHTIIASAADGFKFVNWTENDFELSTSKEYSFIISENRDIQANFKLHTSVFEGDPGEALFKVYPNPASDWLYVENNDFYDISSVALYNTMGQRLIYYELNQGNEGILHLNVADLPAGIYLLYFTGNNTRHFQKIILE